MMSRSTRPEAGQGAAQSDSRSLVDHVTLAGSPLHGAPSKYRKIIGLGLPDVVNDLSQPPGECDTSNLRTFPLLQDPVPCA